MASFVLAGAVGLVLIAGADRVQEVALSEDASVYMTPSPEYAAAIAKLEAQERAEDALMTHEASAR